MTRNKIHALLFATAIILCGAVLAGSPPAASAQAGPSPVPLSQKVVKVRFQVVHMLYTSIQVSSLANARELHTFTYSPRIAAKMQNIFNAGGYQYGDQVVVWYRSGGNVALKIKGKPSKPS